MLRLRDRLRQARHRRERARLLQKLPKGSVGVEIGVWAGDLSAAILRTVQPARLHLLDPWAFAAEEGYEQAWYGGARAGSQEQMDAVYDGVNERFAGRDRGRRRRRPPFDVGRGRFPVRGCLPRLGLRRRQPPLRLRLDGPRALRREGEAGWAARRGRLRSSRLVGGRRATSGGQVPRGGGGCLRAGLPTRPVPAAPDRVARRPGLRHDGVAAVHDQRLAAHHRGFRRGEEADRARHVLRLDEATRGGSLAVDRRASSPAWGNARARRSRRARPRRR